MVGGQKVKFGLTLFNDVLWAQSGAQPWNCRESCTGFATGPGGPGPITGSSTVSVICSCVCVKEHAGRVDDYILSQCKWSIHS